MIPSAPLLTEGTITTIAVSAISPVAKLKVAAAMGSVHASARPPFMRDWRALNSPTPNAADAEATSARLAVAKVMQQDYTNRKTSAGSSPS